MSRTLLSFFLIVTIFKLNSQAKIQFEERKIYLGETEQKQEISVEFNFQNISQDTVRLSYEPITNLVSVKFEKKIYLPNEKGKLNLLFYPEKQGNFNERLDIILNENERIELSIFGVIADMKEVAFRSLNLDLKLNSEKEIIFVFVNGEDYKGVPHAKVFIKNIDNNKSYISTTDEKGVLINRVPEGRYKVQSLANGYEEEVLDIRLDPNRNIALVLLKTMELKDSIKPKAPLKANIQTDSIQKKTEKMLAVNPVNKVEKIEEDTISDAIVDLPILIEEPKPLEKLKVDGSRKILNIILLIDVSKSMENQNRIDALKKTIVNLVQNYESSDQLAILTFNDQVSTLIKRDKVLNKKETIDKILSIQPSGTTDGVLGIDMAFEILQNNMEPNAVNMVIIATDGKMSNTSSEDKKMFEKIEQMNEKGILTSVVGFGATGYENSKLNKMTAIGGGLFIDLNSKLENSESILLDEIYTTLLKVKK